MTDETTWERVCVLCAIRVHRQLVRELKREPTAGELAHRQTRLDEGHCCASCASRLDNDLASIVRNADLEAFEEASTSAGGLSASFESKPPTDLEGIAPYLALVRMNPGVDPPRRHSVANLLGEWERMLRDVRSLAAYGPATEHHIGTDEGLLSAQATRQAVALLRSHLDWIVNEPQWPLEDFANEIGMCARRMHAFSGHADREPGDRVVPCPTLTGLIDDDGDPIACGKRLVVRTWAALDATESVTGRADWSIGDHVTCPRCGATRSPEQLLRAAGKDGAYVDPEAIARWYGLSERTLRRWAARGEIRREHGRYSWADVEARRGSA